MPDTSTPARRFRPGLLPALATVAGIAVFVSAGHWQQGRMEQKQALRAQFDSANAAAPAALPADAVDWTTWRYRPVAITGTFDAPRQVLIDNKVEEGRAGYHVVTPILQADGRAVLVDRGWVASGESRMHLPRADPPAGTVTVRGRVNIPSANYIELERDAHAGIVWQNLDPARFASATGLAVLPIVVEQTTPIDASDRLVRNWAAPDFGIDRHRIYMVQWYLFAATAAGLWLFFNLRRAGKDAKP
ncbi:MAG: SURF1 family protein [Betaproteobacteria bacterium]